MRAVLEGFWRIYHLGVKGGDLLLRLRILLLGGILLSGCSALSNPVANGIPVRRLSPELLGESKAGLATIPLSCLRAPPPDAYRLAPGDVLGIWIEGILGDKGQPPPVRLAEAGNLAPAVGLPVPVRSDGTICLPYLDPIRVQGMTLEQVESAVRHSYTVDRMILQPGRDRICVTLQQPRHYHILVIRQDSSCGDGGGGGGGNGGKAAGFVIGIGGGGRGARRGTGFAIDLPAYENDVLNALARTGGFPGSDAVNEIVIERSAFHPGQSQADLLGALQAGPPGSHLPVHGATQTIRIPLRTCGGQPPPIAPEDVVLHSGDIVFIEAREADVFYTAGLLPPGEYVLPRDVDLDVVEAIARIGGVMDSGGISALNVNGLTTTEGIGIPSPRLVTIIRRTPNCGQVAIRVDLNRALSDPRERILIQPKDVIVLQQTQQDAIAGYLGRIFNFSYVYTFFDNKRSTSGAAIGLP